MLGRHASFRTCVVRGRLLVSFLPALILILALGPFAASAATGPSAYEDLIYATVEGQPLLLDLYVPEGAGPFPLALWIHGGGWMAGDKYLDPGLVQYVLAKGMALASVEYRLTTDTRFQNRTFPAQIQDVKGAIRYLRAHAAQYALDPNRVAVWGGSAGGHLAALLGTSGGVAALEGDVGGNLDRPSRVLAVVDFFGPSDFKVLPEQDPWAAVPGGVLDLLFGHSIQDILAHWEDRTPPYPDLAALVLSAGPVTFVDPTDPPFFISHGDADTVVSVLQSDELVEALKAAGVPVEYHRIPGAGHGGDAMPLVEAIDFLQASLAVPDLEGSFIQDVTAPTDATSVTFTASASGGLAPYEYAWDLAGFPASGSAVTRTFPPGDATVTLRIRDAGGGEVSISKTVSVAYSVAIQSARVRTSPFRLMVYGSGFEDACQIQVGGTVVPETRFVDAGQVMGRGGRALKALLPKGVTVSVTVRTADGRRSAPFTFTR